METFDKDNSMQIDLKEWRDYFRFAPHEKYEEMLQNWRTQSFLCYGERSIPDDFSVEEKQSGLWHKICIASIISGCICQTFTAPLDRARIHMQVFQEFIHLKFNSNKRDT